MKVLQASQYYAPHWHRGGPPRILYDYAKELINIGDEVAVVTSHPDFHHRGKADDAELEGIKIHYFQPQSNYLSRFYFNYSAAEIRGWVRKHLAQYDIVHLAQTRCLLNVILMQEATTLGIPYALSSFGSLPRRSGMLKLVYDQFFVKPLARNAACLLAQTDHEANVYVSYGGSRNAIHLLPLAVDISKIPNLPRRGGFRAKLGENQDAFVVLFLGRLHKTKGVDFLIAAFASAKRQATRLHLAIVGHDEGMERTLRNLVQVHGMQQSITFVGPLYEQDRWAAYAESDLFCITPEIFEETSLASIEALACGTPVITTTRADIPWLELNEAGRVLPAGDLNAMASAIAEFSELNPGQCAATRLNAKKLVQQKFNLPLIVQDLRRIFGQAVKSS